MNIHQTRKAAVIPQQPTSRAPRRMRFCFSVLVLFSTSAARADDAKPLALPAQTFAALPGKVIGVLSNISQALLAAENRKGPADALTLGTGMGSPLWVYLPDQKRPLIGAMTFPVGSDGKQQQRFNRLNLATFRALSSAGITEPFTLVEVEVNGGLGGPPGQALVATAIRSVEGTKLYPLEVAKVVDRLEQHFQKWKSTQKPALEFALQAERKKLGWPSKKETRRTEEELTYVTWLPERMTLHVQIRARLQDLDPLFRPSKPPRAYEGDDGAIADRNASRTVGAEIGLGFEVARDGKIDRVIPIPVRGFHSSLTPIQSGRSIASQSLSNSIQTPTAR
jgi:hypothetical protein